MLCKAYFGVKMAYLFAKINQLSDYKTLSINILNKC